MNPFKLSSKQWSISCCNRPHRDGTTRGQSRTHGLVGSGRIAVLEHIIGLAANFGEVTRRVQLKCRFTQPVECPRVAWTAGSKRPILRPVGKLPAKDPAIEGEG
jgi:hypothetical protein